MKHKNRFYLKVEAKEKVDEMVWGVAALHISLILEKHCPKLKVMLTKYEERKP